MKEQKKKGVRKVLLMGVACALVAAISVSLTLAYLTAKTDVKTNTFKASPGITGEPLEPNYDQTVTHKVVPGVTEAKDPLLQNTTTNGDIIVGAKVSFYVDIGGGYKKVTYDVLKNFVDFKYGDDAGWNLNTAIAADTDKWVQYTKTKTTNVNSTADGTVASDKLSAEDKSLYFIYSDVLSQMDTSLDTTKATNGENTLDQKYGSGAQGNDNTYPLFTSVTPKSALKITSSVPTGGTSAGTSTLGTSPADTIDNYFSKFDYKIIVDFYGVKNDESLSGTEAERITTASGTILEQLAAISRT